MESGVWALKLFMSFSLIIFVGVEQLQQIRVGFGLWRRSLFDFLSRSDGGAVLIRKTVVEETQFQSKFRF